MVQKQQHKKPINPAKQVPPKPSGTKKATGKNSPIKIFSEKKANRYFVLFFFLFSFLLYGNTIWNKWAVDDEFVTGPDNQLVTKGFKAIPEIFSTTYISQTGNLSSQNADYRPIVKLTYALEYAFWGGNKAGRSHAVNILIYFFISITLFFILKRLFSNYNVLFPFLVTLLFMVHPVHSEVVASLKNRDEMLAFLCGLGGLYFFLRYADEKKVKFFIFALVTFFVGYLSKSSILPFLLIYPLTLYFFKNLPPKQFLWIFLGVVGVVILAQFGPNLFIGKTPRVNSYIENPLFFEKNFWIRTGTGLVSLLFYIKMLFYPYPLLYYYGYDTIPITNWSHPLVWVSFLIYASLLLFALWKLKEKHVLSYAILFYLIFIAMYSNILFPVVGIVGERFVFAASTGFCIAFVYLVFKIFRTDPKRLTIEISERTRILVLVILLVIPSGYLVIKRNRAWRNLYDLCARDVSKLERSAKANIQYAGVLLNKIYKSKEEDRSMMAQSYAPVVIKYFRKGLEIYPENYETLNDLATVYLNLGQFPDSAMTYLRQAKAIDSTLRPAWVNMGLAYRQLKQYDSAILCYQHILKEDPNEMKAVSSIANIYNEMGDLQKAMDLNQEIIQKDPKSDVPFRNMGNYAIQRGDTATAVQYWEQAAQLKPSYDVYMQLYSMYRLKGDIETARRYYDLASGILDAQKKK